MNSLKKKVILQRLERQNLFEKYRNNFITPGACSFLDWRLEESAKPALRFLLR